MPEAKKSQVSPWTVWVVGLNLAALGLLLVLLYSLRGIFAIVLLAVFLTLAVDPIVQWLQRHHFTRGWAIFTVIAGFIILAGLVMLSFVPMFVEQGSSLAAAMPGMVERLQQSRPFLWAQEHFNLTTRVTAAIEKHGETMASGVLGAAWSVVSAIFALVTVLVLSVFMLIFGGELVSDGLNWARPSHRDRYAAVVNHVRVTIGRFVLGTLVIALVGGVFITAVLIALGVPYFMPLGFAMVLAGLVPYLGPILGAVLIVGVTLATLGWVKALVMAAVFVFYQFTENNFLQPVVQKRAIELNPVVVIIAMLIGASLAGLLGTVLALPVAGTIKAVLADLRKRRGDSAGSVMKPPASERKDSRPTA